VKDRRSARKRRWRIGRSESQPRTVTWKPNDRHPRGIINLAVAGFVPNKTKGGPSVKRIAGIDPNWGVTVVRVSTGVIFLVHGVQKFVGGLGGVTAFFAKVGIPAPGVMGPFVAILEVVGGVLLIVGLATRWISLLFAIEMIVTTLWVQIPARGWNASDLDRALLASSLLLVLAGSGIASLDAIWLEKGEPSEFQRQ